MTMPAPAQAMPPMIATIQKFMWMPGSVSGAADRKWKSRSTKNDDMNQPAQYAPMCPEGDVAEVEQARVADDDVQTQRQQHEVGDDQHRRSIGSQ